MTWNVHWSNVVFQKQILTTNSCIHFWPRALRSLVLLMQQKLHRIKEARIHDSTSLHSTRFQGYLKLTQAIPMANPLMLSHDIKYQKDCKHGNYNCACGLHFKYKYQLFLFYSVKCHHKWWCMAKHVMKRLFQIDYLLFFFKNNLYYVLLSIWFTF